MAPFKLHQLVVPRRRPGVADTQVRVVLLVSLAAVGGMSAAPRFESSAEALERQVCFQMQGRDVSEANASTTRASVYARTAVIPNAQGPAEPVRTCLERLMFGTDGGVHGCPVQLTSCMPARLIHGSEDL